jgi:hypothetical protein
VKRGLTIGLVIAALGAGAPLAISSPREPVTAADAIPAYEVLTRVREIGLHPTTQALRRGSYYVLHAVDTLGVEMRVVADAEFGDILSVTPVRPYGGVSYRRGPRIIDVPQAGGDSLDPDYRDDAVPAPSPAKPRRRSAVPTAPRAEGPNPIYPTPKFSGTATDDGEKFGPPEDH